MDSEYLRAKLALYSSEPDPAGHVTWSGRRRRSTRPIIKYGGREIPVAHLVFQQRTGREPVGTCRADCDVNYCIASGHVQDDLERRQVRLQLRALYRWQSPWDLCPRGHGWDEHGRVEPDLTLYCKQCNSDRSRKRNPATEWNSPMSSCGSDDPLVQAGQEIQDLKAKAEAVLETLARLDSGVVAPDQIWRYTLNKIWYELMDAGDFAGALTVSRILSTLPAASGS